MIYFTPPRKTFSIWTTIFMLSTSPSAVSFQPFQQRRLGCARFTRPAVWTGDLCPAQKSVGTLNFVISTTYNGTPTWLSATNGSGGNFFGDLWDEMIEVATYGPSERKIRKVRQLEADTAAAMVRSDDDDYDNGVVGVTVASQSIRVGQEEGSLSREKEIEVGIEDDDDTWLRALQDAKGKKNPENMIKEQLDYDGYQLRDLVVRKWNAPLDIDFQRSYDNRSVYCTILPIVGFGNKRKSRHKSELDYLMHLQGVVEVLYRYDVLDEFLASLENTKRRPKSGTDSVPFRLDLNDTDLNTIMNGKKPSSKT